MFARCNFCANADVMYGNERAESLRTSSGCRELAFKVELTLNILISKSCFIFSDFLVLFSSMYRKWRNILILMIKIKRELDMNVELRLHNYIIVHVYIYVHISNFFGFKHIRMLCQFFNFFYVCIFAYVDDEKQPLKKLLTLNRSNIKTILNKKFND